MFRFGCDDALLKDDDIFSRIEGVQGVSVLVVDVRNSSFFLEKYLVKLYHIFKHLGNAWVKIGEGCYLEVLNLDNTPLRNNYWVSMG